VFLYYFNDCLNEINDQLFYIHRVQCNFNRLPSLNINESTQVINGSCHQKLKRAIIEVVQPLLLRENKEKAFEFIEKFYYNQNLIENVSSALNKMKRDSSFHLNLTNHLLKLLDIENKEYVR
jgi:hypothetical protein